MSIVLNVEATAGSEIEETAGEMIELANRIRVSVRVQFNDVSVLAMPGDDPADIARSYRHEARSKFPVKVATARGGRMLAQ
jgi:hypothetical protein